MIVGRIHEADHVGEHTRRSHIWGVDTRVPIQPLLCMLRVCTVGQREHDCRRISAFHLLTPPSRVGLATEETGATQDHGLESPVPQRDIDNAPPNYDPLGRATEQTTNLILLDREVRASNAVFNAANYAAGNKTTLSGTSQWSHEDSNPLTAIADALDSVVMRPTIGVLGRAVSTKLRRHPKVVKAFNGTLGDEGMVPLQWLAEILELEAILVGEARLNIARPGQAANLSRVWGNHASFIYRDELADANNGTTCGFTAEVGGRIATSSFDKNIGLRGGQMVRVGESVKELITAPDLGYFFENAIS